MRSGLLSLIPAIALSGAAMAEEPIMFTSHSGETVEAFQGAFSVPENRRNPDSRMIEIGYVRFPALEGASGSPIVYLAGGPGGSGTGTARRQRFDLFMQMRRHGDVIAFDQRGTGLSINDLPTCVSDVRVSETEPSRDADLAHAYRQAMQDCRVFWSEAGIDIEGYTTAESVEDIADLRTHLGAEQVTLWGISYGTHLALAALKAIPDQIDRAILASAEGLDQTVKLPSQTEAYFDRLQQAVNTQPATAALYPDIAALMTRVHERMEQAPMMIEVRTAGGVRPFLLQRRDLQQITSGLIADPGTAAIALAMYAEIDQAGSAHIASAIVGQYYELGQPITLQPMPAAMDLASGISAARLAQVDAQLSENVRVQQFAAYWTAVWYAPVLGQGLGGFPFMARLYEMIDTPRGVMMPNAAHNLFLQWMLQAGMVGTLGGAAVLAGLVQQVRRGLSRRRRQRELLRGLLVVIVFVLAHAMVDFALEISGFFWLFCWMLGLGAGIANRSKSDLRRAGWSVTGALAAVLALAAGVSALGARDHLAADRILMLSDARFVARHGQTEASGHSARYYEAIGDRALRLVEPDYGLAYWAFSRSLAEEPRDGEVWGKRAFAGYHAFGVMTEAGIEDLRRSYLLLPYGGQSYLQWRSRFVLGVWAELPDDVRAAAQRESRALPGRAYQRWLSGINDADA